VIVLGLDSAITCAGFALLERTAGRERVLDHGRLRAVDGDVVARFAAQMMTGAPSSRILS